MTCFCVSQYYYPPSILCNLCSLIFLGIYLTSIYLDFLKILKILQSLVTAVIYKHPLYFDSHFQLPI